MKLTQNFLSLKRTVILEDGTTNTFALRARGLNGEPVHFRGRVEKIIIHWIGPYLQRITTPRDWWENGSDGRGVQASAHFIVKDEDVLQALPLNEVGWHSGDNRNHNSIGIEVCPMNVAGQFSEVTIKTLRELIKHIQITHPSARTIERHFDGVQGKDCPRYYTPVTSLLDGGGRVANPEGGNERWIELRNILMGVGESQ